VTSDSEKHDWPVSRKYFYIEPDREDFFSEFDALVPSLARFRSIGLAFRENLSAAVLTATMPLMMGWTAVEQKRFQMFMVAAQLRAKYIYEYPEEVRDQRALEDANASHELAMATEGGSKNAVNIP
jgi:hypothetical protein